MPPCQYSPPLHWNRVIGLAFEWADQARLPGYKHAGADDAELKLNPRKPSQIVVSKANEPRLPDLLRWALKVKQHVDQELAKVGCLVRGPLSFRGRDNKRPQSQKGPGAAGSGVQTNVVITGRRRPETVNVDLRFVIEDSNRTGDYWACLCEQKYRRSLADAQRDADAARDGKLLRAAESGEFELPGARQGSTISARSAACASLALTSTEWSFEVRVRRDWNGFPCGLARSVNGTLPFPFPFPQGISRGEAAPAADLAATPASTPAAKPAAKPGAKKPAARKPAAKPAKGGRAYIAKGRKKRCSGVCVFQRKRDASEKDQRKNYQCQYCRCQPERSSEVPPLKFSRKRCARGKCRFEGPEGRCTVCNRKPAH